MCEVAIFLMTCDNSFQNFTDCGNNKLYNVTGKEQWLSARGLKECSRSVHHWLSEGGRFWRKGIAMSIAKIPHCEKSQ